MSPERKLGQLILAGSRSRVSRASIDRIGAAFDFQRHIVILLLTRRRKKKQKKNARDRCTEYQRVPVTRRRLLARCPTSIASIFVLARTAAAAHNAVAMAGEESFIVRATRGSEEEFFKCQNSGGFLFFFFRGRSF